MSSLRWLAGSSCRTLRAAAERPALPLVREALRAAAERSLLLRLRALDLDCLDSELRAAAEWPSRFNAPRVARERVDDTLRSPFAALFVALFALRRVFSDVLPFFGDLSFTPARRALFKPIVIACLLERAPCLPSRT